MHEAQRLESRVEDVEIIRAASSLSALGNNARLPLVVSALSDPDISVTDIVAAMKRQPDLSARVLRVANSAYYGQTRSIDTVDRAIMLLGLDAVRGIAAAACFNHALISSKDTALLDTTAFLRHSVAVAVAAETLARRHHRVLAPAAFVAGLMHDLGTVVALQIDPDGVKRLREDFRTEPHLDIRPAEEQRVRVGHGQCVSVVLQAWQLPEPLVVATQFHHEPMLAPEAHRPLAALVNVADHIARTSGLSFPCEAALGGANPEAMALLELGPADLEEISATLHDSVASLQQSLN